MPKGGQAQGPPPYATANNWLLYHCLGKGHFLLCFLGRLPKVDLIILEGEKYPSVRPSVRPQKSFFNLNEIWYIGRGR